MQTFQKNINSVSRAQTQFLDEKLRAAGIALKGSQSKYIFAVCKNAGLSQDGMAKYLFVNKSNASRQLSQLEADGYVERRCGDDKRESLIFPTQKALNILPKLRELHAEWRERLTAGFTEEEKEMLDNLTERLYANAVKMTGGGL